MELEQANKSLLYRHLDFILLFVMLVVALCSFRQYGIGWDEDVQREIGLKNWEYISGANSDLLTYPDRDYGVAFEMPLIFLEKALHLQESRSIYLMRHLVTHLFFLAAAFFLFRLIDLLYRNKWLAATGFLLLLLHPHLFAHSFFNTKDLPFLSMFTICFYLMARAFRKGTGLNFILLGSAIGLLINMRIMGVLLLCCVLFFVCVDAVMKKELKNGAKQMSVLLFFTCIVLYATWPFLWKAPLRNFMFAFENMSRFRWDLENLFMGKMVKGKEIAWNYIPVWFSITTPIAYLVAGLFGLFVLLGAFVKKPLAFTRSLEGKCNLVFAACFFCPVIMVIVLHSVLYDTWRQLFFVYPPLVLIMVFGIHRLWQSYPRTWLAAAGAVAALVSFAPPAFFMIAHAPYQHIYFNEFVTQRHEPEYLRKNYDLDYWGTSYRESLEFLLKHDPSPRIDVAISNEPGWKNLYILTGEQKKRINIVDVFQAKYFVSNFRWHPHDYDQQQIYAVKVGNSTINTVLKLK